MPIHFTKLTLPKKSEVFDQYWLFAYERFEIFKRRLENPIGPWTNDEVISNHRFTNVFRASDRVSQFLIDIQYKDSNEENIFFKTILFKLFNKIETYQYLEKELEEINFSSFSLQTYNDLLTSRFEDKTTLYSAAYIMPSAGSYFGHRYKHTNHLALLSKMIKDGIVNKIIESKKLENVYQLLLSYPSLGQFLAFQYTIDLNYSTLLNFSEMDFVVAGPGAKNGIKKCFDSLGEYSFEDIIRLVTDEQENECIRLGIDSPTLWGRPLQLIDCQNIFCEVDKYLRVTMPELNLSSGKSRIKQKYKVSKQPFKYFFPPKWELSSKDYNIWKASENIFL